MPKNVNTIDLIRAQRSHEQITSPTGHARGKGDLSGKGHWIGGVKHSCHRQQSYNSQSDFGSEGDFSHFCSGF
jgi:hypothetical protein